MTRVQRNTFRIGSMAAVIACAVGVDQREAKAFGPADIFVDAWAAGQAIKSYYSTMDWFNCQFSGFCPPTDAQVQADRVIDEVTSVYTKYWTDQWLGELRGRVGQAHRVFGDPTAQMSEEADLVQGLETWLDTVSESFESIDPNVQAEVDQAYILAPAFAVGVALLDLVERTELVTNHVAMTVDQLNLDRATALTAMEALVGAQSLWYSCPGSSTQTQVSTAQSYDNSFPTAKLWKDFADYHVTINQCGNAYDCDPFNRVSTPTGNVCNRNCNNNFLHLCYACVGPDPYAFYTHEVPKIQARMNRDQAVITIRATMELLVGEAATHASGLLWRQPGGETDLWDIWSNTSYRSYTLNFPSPVWQVAGTGDFNGDGAGDILWIDRQDGLLSIWELQGPDVVQYTPATADAPNLNALVPYVGDLDGDGVSDIVWTGTTTVQPPAPVPPITIYTSQTWMMSPGSTIPSSTSTTTSQTDQLQGMGDFERWTSVGSTLPYRVQKIYRTPSTGAVSIDAYGSRVDLGIVSTDWVIIGTGDFDGDGLDDIAWVNTNNGEVSIWMMVGYQHMWTSNPIVMPPSDGWLSQGVVAADVDHDGFTDIAFRNTSGGVVVLMMTAGATVQNQTFWMPSPPNGTGAELVGAVKLGPRSPQNAPATLIATNYCGATTGQLRNAGFAGYENWASSSFFGVHGTLTGDVDGDGKDDLVALTDSEVDLMRSAGGTGQASEIAFPSRTYGPHNTLLGDVTGDGKADLVEVSAGSVGVIPSNGVAFTSYTGWFTGTFDDWFGTLLGDVDGDGKTDLVILGRTSVQVLRSAGSSFGPLETGVASQVHGTTATLLADVDGDGRADLVAVSSGSVTVFLGTGGSPLFSTAGETWYSGLVWGSHGLLLRDVNGDGRADFVALDDQQVRVFRSQGSSFGTPEIWWNNPFYGSHGTFLADLDGNGKADLLGVGDGYVGATRSQ